MPVHRRLSENVLELLQAHADTAAAGAAPAAAADDDDDSDDTAAAGASGLDSAWGLALWLVDQGVLELPRLVAACHDAPLAILGQPAEGLAEGACANLVLIDTRAKAPVDPAGFASRGRNTPLATHATGGTVVLSMADGRLIHEALDDTRRRR